MSHSSLIASRAAKRTVMKRLFRAVDAGEDAKAVAPLLAQILQGLLHRPFLPVAELGALEQISPARADGSSDDSESSLR